MFNRHYAAELAHLREMGRELARVNPSLATVLADGSGDPDVERLLEGFAFLTARIRERTEAGHPELVDAIADLVAPLLVRPVPAATVIELRPQLLGMRAGARIAAGTPFGSREVDGVRCLFRSVEPIDVLPLELGATTVDLSRASAPELRVAVHLSEHGRGPLLDVRRLRFFLAGPWATASAALLWLDRHLAAVRLEGEGATPLVLGPERVKLHPRAEAREDASDALGLTPWPALCPDGTRRLREHFQLPAAHLFFELDLEGLEDAHLSESMALRFVFTASAPPLPEAPPSDFVRTHCVAAVNLFDVDAEPMRREPLRRDHWLRAAGLAPDHAEIFELRSLVGIRAQRGGRVRYAPLYAGELADPSYESWQARRDPRNEESRYRLRRMPSPLDGGVDTHVELLGATPLPGAPEETLSAELTCTHRWLPAALRTGDVCVGVAGSPSGMAIRNVTPVSKPVSAAVGDELQWRLLRHLALGRRSLSELPALRALLHDQNRQRAVDEPLSAANDRRVEAIRAISSRTVARPVGGAVLRGTETTVELDLGGFSGPGDAFVFGCALDSLFAAQVPVNTFHRLKVRLHPTDGEITWTPRTGTRPSL